MKKILILLSIIFFSLNSYSRKTATVILKSTPYTGMSLSYYAVPDTDQKIIFYLEQDMSSKIKTRSICLFAGTVKAFNSYLDQTISNLNKNSDKNELKVFPKGTNDGWALITKAKIRKIKKALRNNKLN